MPGVSNGRLWATAESVLHYVPIVGNLTLGIDISAFSYSKKDNLPIFRPTSKPLCEFPTPILQLDSLKSSIHSNVSSRHPFLSEPSYNH